MRDLYVDKLVRKIFIAGRGFCGFGYNFFPPHLAGGTWGQWFLKHLERGSHDTST